MRCTVYLVFVCLYCLTVVRESCPLKTRSHGATRMHSAPERWLLGNGPW